MVLLLAIVALAAGQALAAQLAQTNPAPAFHSSGDALVAKGRGFEIRRSQVDAAVKAAQAQLAANGRVPNPDQADEAARQVLDQLITFRLLNAKATAADQAAGKAAAGKRFAEARKKAGSEEATAAELKRLGTTREALLAKWTEAMTGDEVLKREFQINITDSAARKFYEEHPAEFEVPEMVRASHIFFALVDPKTGAAIPDDQQALKRKTAEAVLQRARAGEDFAKLAREFSEDPVSKVRGGEYTFPRGKMPAEFEAAAFALNTNQISDGIVTSRYGYHVIKVSEKLPAHKVAFAEAVAEIKNTLARQAIEPQFPEYLAKLKREAGVEILEEKLKPKPPGLGTVVAPEAFTQKPGKKP